MTAAQVVDTVMSSEYADLVRESVAWLVGELMEVEVAAQIGADYGERVPERRTAQRNGYRERGWDTRVGEIELAIPRLRSGPAYFPSFLEPRRRAEQALVAVVQEAYVGGSNEHAANRTERAVAVLNSTASVREFVRRITAAMAEVRRVGRRAAKHLRGDVWEVKADYKGLA